MHAANVEEYQEQFKVLAEGKLVIMIKNTDGSTHPVIDHIFVTTKIDKDIITTAYKYINGDSQFVDQFKFPLQLYEIKVQMTANFQLFTPRLRERHAIPEEDTLYVTDVWRCKFHRGLRDHDDIVDITRRSDDIFV